jgi:hypothetical protein
MRPRVEPTGVQSVLALGLDPARVDPGSMSGFDAEAGVAQQRLFHQHL